MKICYENLSRNPRFVCNVAKISVALHKDQSTFYCCRLHKFALKQFLYNTEHFYIVDLTCSSALQIERIIAFALQQCLRESATSLHYAFIACLWILYLLFEVCLREYILLCETAEL